MTPTNCKHRLGKVQTIPDSALTSAPMAQPRIGWLLWGFRGSGRIFVVGDDGAIHHIPDMETFLARFEWKNVLRERGSSESVAGRRGNRDGEVG